MCVRGAIQYMYPYTQLWILPSFTEFCPLPVSNQFKQLCGKNRFCQFHLSAIYLAVSLPQNWLGTLAIFRPNAKLEKCNFLVSFFVLFSFLFFCLIFVNFSLYYLIVTILYTLKHFLQHKQCAKWLQKSKIQKCFGQFWPVLASFAQFWPVLPRFKQVLTALWTNPFWLVKSATLHFIVT